MLNFGGAKLWRISLHKNFEVLNFGETSTKQIIVDNLENFGGLYLAIERQSAKFAKVLHHQSLAVYGMQIVHVHNQPLVLWHISKQCYCSVIYFR